MDWNTVETNSLVSCINKEFLEEKLLSHIHCSRLFPQLSVQRLLALSGSFLSFSSFRGKCWQFLNSREIEFGEVGGKEEQHKDKRSREQLWGCLPHSSSPAQTPESPSLWCPGHTRLWLTQSVLKENSPKYRSRFQWSPQISSWASTLPFNHSFPSQ